MKLIRVLVVDDSGSNREILSDMIESSPFLVVAGTACDGKEAIEKTVKLSPDLITLDLEMPGMDGFTFLRWLMRTNPVPVIVISSRADDRSVIRALEYGAVDFLPKPVSRGRGLEDLKRELVEKVKNFAMVEMAKVQSSVAIIEEAARKEPEKWAARGEPAFDMVAIGASTGGPPAIQAIITKLPANFPAAVTVSQHMPPKFTRFFAERLDKLSALEVKEAEEGDLVLPGRVLICPGGNHMNFVKRRDGVKVALVKPDPADKTVPSVDSMMKSAVQCYGQRVLGVLLTGMGNDGMEGMISVKGSGGTTIAESSESAVIYGMPKAAVGAGVVDFVLPLGSMAEKIIDSCD